MAQGSDDVIDRRVHLRCHSSGHLGIAAVLGDGRKRRCNRDHPGEEGVVDALAGLPQGHLRLCALDRSRLLSRPQLADDDLIATPRIDDDGREGKPAHAQHGGAHDAEGPQRLRRQSGREAEVGDDHAPGHARQPEDDERGHRSRAARPLGKENRAEAEVDQSAHACAGESHQPPGERGSAARGGVVDDVGQDRRQQDDEQAPHGDGVGTADAIQQRVGPLLDHQTDSSAASRDAPCSR